MQVSAKVTQEILPTIEPSPTSREKSDCEIIPKELQVAQEEVQKAKQALADFLEPTIIATNNGAVSDKTFDEIVREGIEKAKRKRR